LNNRLYSKERVTNKDFKFLWKFGIVKMIAINMNYQQLFNICSLSALILLSACQQETSNNQKTPQKQTNTFFQLLDAQKTGVNFSNQVQDRNDMNVLTYRNHYNGGGVAIGDINNDGLSDLYFTANLTKNKLYLNKGNLQFEDISEQAGIGGTKAWSTGVTMADVNGDGWLDIYVSNSGDIAGDNKENELYINNGDLTFTESATAYGLNNEGYSTQAAFFDYDMDGDLDCYLLNNSFKDPSKIELYKNMRAQVDELGGDKLYRNDDGKFTDVTKEAGIFSSAIGFGLGAAIGDVNNDLLPDIYVSNDFWERDYLYINQGDGTFSEELTTRINFCSISSMGGDIADINNDGHPEIISTDMLAADNYRLKAMSAFDPYHLEDAKYRANYHYQIGQNCLHLNDGQGRFQEIAMLAGVAATDWSWGALAFDFENDGNKDLFVSNGIQRDLMYMDFRDFMANNNMYVKMARGESVDYPALTAQMPSNPIKNFAFKNIGKLQFDNQANALGFSQASFSNGAAYGDLDNDGDLDLVINNVNTPAFVYENEAEKTANHYLKVKFKGGDKNPFGIGAKVQIATSEGIQTLQNFNTRGFESSVEPHLLFGLGSIENIEELEVIWTNGKKQILTNIAANQELTLQQSDATLDATTEMTPPQPLFAEATSKYLQGDSKHQENRYNDFDHETLLLGMLSTESPRIVQGDVNGDGLEDFVLLGARNDEDKLFVQTTAGKFIRKTNEAFTISKMMESTCGAFLDADQDGDLDLMLGAGGNEYQQGAGAFILRFFENLGDGNLRLNDTNIPRIVGNFSCIEASDFDKDGDTDLFVGGRVVPGNYGLPPRSYLLINNGGTWQEKTPEPLAGIGMLSDAAWADIDKDGDEDLVIVGDWMSVQIFENQNGTLSKMIEIPNSKGWWQRVEAADLDSDGDVDFVLGNWGTNSKFQASPERPLSMYVNDFDKNGKSEFIINWYAPLDKRSYPFATKSDLISQLPELRKKALKYEDYSKQTYDMLFPAEVRQRSFPYEANYLKSAVLWNNAGQFELKALPVEAQVSPVFGIAVHDWNADGFADIWLGGNFYALKPQVGRQDASRGIFLEGKGKQQFQPVSSMQSGIYVEGEVRDATILRTNKESVLVVSRNDKTALIFDRQ